MRPAHNEAHIFWPLQAAISHKRPMTLDRLTKCSPFHSQTPFWKMLDLWERIADSDV
jgi:hypothetical protein